MKKRLIIHDLSKEQFNSLDVCLDSDVVIAADGKYAPCKGCFGCWIKTPGKCVMKDKLQNIASEIMQSDELIIISKNCYGGFSGEVKNILDRSIADSLPFFTFRNGEIHHCRRYPKSKVNLIVYFYGDMTDKEKVLADKLVKANGVNAAYKSTKLYIVEHIEDIKEVLA